MKLRMPGTMTAMIAMASRVSSQMALLGVTLVATRVLSPADFGVFAIAAALTMLGRTLLYTGPFEFLLKASDARRDSVSSACLAANVIVATGGGLLLVGIGIAAPWLFKGAGVAHVIFALAPSNLIAAVSGWMEALLLRSGQLRRYYVITLTMEFAAGIGAALLLLSGFGLWALVAQVYLRLVLLALAYAVILKPSRLARLEAGTIVEVLRWSRSRYGSVIVGFLSTYSGDLLLGISYSPAASGLYRASNRMVTALSDMFTQPAGMLATTTLGAARARGDDDNGSWLQLTGLFAALAWPALAILALVADRAAPLLLGPAWVAAGPAISLFCIARMAGLVSTVASSRLVISDRQGSVLVIQSIAAAATGGLIFFAAPYGTRAAAGAVALVSVVVAITLAYGALRSSKVRPSLNEVARLALVPLIGGFSAACLGDTMVRHEGFSGNVALVAAIACGAIGWSLAAWSILPSFRRALPVLEQKPTAA